MARIKLIQLISYKKGIIIRMGNIFFIVYIYDLKLKISKSINKST